MGKTHRGRRLGESETAIQCEALSDLFSPGHQADPVSESGGDAERKSGSSLLDQTPSHEGVRGSHQGVGNQTWVNSTFMETDQKLAPEPRGSALHADETVYL